VTQLLLFLLLAFGCGSEPNTRSVQPPKVTQTDDIGLSHRAELVVELELPKHSRTTNTPTPEKWKVTSQWTALRSDEKNTEYVTDKPYKLLRYGVEKGELPDGLIIQTDGEGALPFDKQRTKKVGPPNTFGLLNNRLVVRTAKGSPEPMDVWVSHRGANTEELSRHFDTAGLDKKDFVFRTVGLSDVRAHGLYLPAPASLAFEFQVPEAGIFETEAHILLPAITLDGESDGATLKISVSHGDTVTELADVVLTTDEAQSIRINLARWSGKNVQLRLETDPQATTHFDQVFLKDPVVYTPQDRPQRMLFTLIDTLRADHLGTYGYQRQTSPHIDGFADSAVVFEQTRSPAPWTLPSSLAAMYGRTPEHIDGHLHLGEILGRKGWASCAAVSNNWLLSPEDLGTGWSEHWAKPQSSASTQAEKILTCLEKYPNRNVLLFLHMIDPHTPYIEEKRFRGRFTESTPKGLKKRLIGQKVVKRALKNAKTEKQRNDIQQYLRDRYDQNILAVDEAFGAVLQKVGSEATVVVTSDHGEEFFEHGEYEHGRTLYDELVHVPLLIRTPTLTPGRITSPVTLMDIVPTLLPLVGLEGLSQPTDGLIGIDLSSVAMNVPGAASTLEARPLALGRTLQANDHWGVYVNGRKWISTGRKQQLYDLTTDPDEQTNIAKDTGVGLSQYPKILTNALKREVKRVIRISSKTTRRTILGKSSRIEVRHPAGIKSAWISNDARMLYAKPVIEDGVVVVPITDNKKTANELFILLPDGVDPMGLIVSRETEGEIVRGTVKLSAPQSPERPLLVVGDKSSGFVIDTSWQAIPNQMEGITFRGEVTDDLRALGYIE
jgi:arylsulfatase A-like enzyme